MRPDAEGVLHCVGGYAAGPLVAHAWADRRLYTGDVDYAMTVVPPSFSIPPKTIAIGDPVTLYSPDEKEALAAAIKSLGFARTAFGIEAPWDDRMARYRQAAEVRSREFESHAGDTIVQDS